MRFRVFSLALVLGLALTAAPDLSACGDKFLVARRGLSPQDFASFEPGSILIYRGVDAEASDADSWNPEFLAALEDVGHTVAVTDDPETFRRTLEASEFDLVMLELADAVEMQQEVESASGGATILPVVPYGTRRELKQARQQFGNALKMPNKINNALYVVFESLIDN